MGTTTTYQPALYRHEHRTKAATKGEYYTVFIVEDNFASRVLLERYLKKLPNTPADKKPNLEIHVFETGEDAVYSKLRPDILILDYYLNESNKNALDGLGVLRKIRKKNPNVKSIILSGQQNVMVTAELYNEGASDYVAKEHSCTVRVEQSLLRLITEIKKERSQRIRNIIYATLIFSIGLISGLLI